VLVRFSAPALGAVARATLRLYVSSGSSAGLVVRSASPAFSETGVTWASAGAPGAEVARVADAASRSWVTFDVSAAVRSGGAAAFRVETPGSRQVSVAAREAGSATAAQLVLEAETVVTPSPTPTTASPTPTASPSASPTGSPSASPSSLTFPIRAAFYYPWFPEAWNQSGISPFTRYQPSRGYYDGRQAGVVSSQIAEMQYGGMDAGIASWWGRGSKEDLRIPLLLQAAAGTGFRWSLYHEGESLGDPSASEIAADLSHIASSFASDPAYLRVDGKPVIFVYADAADACGMADRWAAGNTSGFYVVLKVFSGYGQCAKQPQGWHQYAPAVATDRQGTWSYAVSPGFWHRNESTARLGRDLARFDADVAAMAASGARFQLLTTFNEWGEGTSVESATQWATASGKGAYLDVLHKHLGARGVTPAPTSTTVGPSPMPTTASPSPATTTTPPTGSDPVVAAVGDIACDPTSSSFNGGAGTSTNCRHKAVADAIAGVPGLTAVLPLGDIQYEDGTLEKFRASYDLSWGRFKAISKPVPGNHEYLTSGASGYYAYYGSIAGDPAKGYYSYDLGSWHVVAINSNCSQAGGCAVGSPQMTWLEADLAAHPTQCTLAYWHHPLFSSGQHGNNPSMAPMWDALAAAGTELVLSGHDHMYERFAPQTSAGVARATGIRQFVVGSGGKNHTGVGTLKANSEARNSDTYGSLQLTLRPGAYSWAFLPEAGRTYADSGTAQCH
jgi:hypothetical protein